LFSNSVSPVLSTNCMFTLAVFSLSRISVHRRQTFASFHSFPLYLFLLFIPIYKSFATLLRLIASTVTRDSASPALILMSQGRMGCKASLRHFIGRTAGDTCNVSDVSLVNVIQWENATLAHVVVIFCKLMNCLVCR